MGNLWCHNPDKADNRQMPAEIRAEVQRELEQGRQPTSTSTTQDVYYQCPVSHTPDVANNRQMPAEIRAEVQRELEQGRQPTSTSSAQHFYYQCPVSQTNISNASNVCLGEKGHVSLGDKGHRGCLTQESVITRIDNLKKIFVRIHQLETAEDLLERYGHAAICGAPGDGKTSIALMLCKIYLKKHYEVLFIEHIEQFDVNVIIKRHNHMLIVFDDIFGSVTFPSNLENTQKVFSALEEALQTDILEKECKTRTNQGRRQAKPDQDKSQPSEKESQQTFKLRFLFTSRTYNWNEGRARLHQFKVNLFNLHCVIDLSKKCLTVDEKETILRSHMRRYPMCDISEEDVKTIARSQTKMLGYPLICSLYASNPDFHVQSPQDFFQNPVTYLRGHLDTIVRERSSRSAALILLLLCDQKLDLVSFQLGKEETDMFQVVKEVVPSCTPTEISNEIGNLTGTYCTVEKNMAFFSHPSIYDATACAFGNYNPILLLKHCSLKFLYERVKREKRGQQQPGFTDDVTNLIHLSPGLYPLVLTRLVEGIRQGYFKWTLKHPIFNNDDISSSFPNNLSDNLPQIIQQEDKVFGECFFYWVSQSDNHALFEQSLEMLVKKEIGMALSHRSITDLRSGIVACVQHGRLSYLKQIITVLNGGEAFNVNMTKGDKSLHMIAAESGHLDVFRFLLEEGADITLTDSKGYTCLHHSCKSGSTDITRVIAELVPGMINVLGYDRCTPAMLCISSREDLKDLKLLVKGGADLCITDMCGMTCLHLACKRGSVFTVKYLMSLKTFDINRKGGLFMQTPVMMAAQRGHYDVYNLLVSEGADLSLTDKYNSDCLMWACKGGNVSIVKHLLSLKTFDINRKGGKSKQTPVMMAAEEGHYDVYNLLVSEGADLSLTDKCNSDCLMWACEGGNLSFVKHLLSLKTFDINRKGGLFMQTPVMMAAQRGHYDVYNLLVSEGADLSLTDEGNSDCLMWACKGGNMSIVKHLLSLKIFDINRKGGLFMQTPVMMAARRGHYDVYNLLVSEGADLSLTDKGNSDCLMWACKGGNMSIVKHLLSLKTFDINRKGGKSKQTPVMMAAVEVHYDVYNLLVSEGADLSLTDKYNSDCLMLACEGGNMSIVKHLLSLKTFDINRKGGLFMQTPVMMAAFWGHYDVYNLFVSEGADLSLTDDNNSDCLMLACEEGNLSVVKHLLSLKTFDINRKGGLFMQTPVMMAAQRGHYDVYNLFVSEGADLSLTDEDNSDCLMWACKGGNMSVVKHLLSLKTFDINRKGGKSKQTPVMMAAEKGHYDVYNLLVSEGADLSLTDKCNSDCLMLACEGGNLSFVKHLLSLKTFDINRKGGLFMQTPVMMAAEKGHYDVYNLLVSEGADLSLTDKLESDCLMWACVGGNLSVVKHLLSLKTFDINRNEGFYMQTPVMMAAEKGHYDVYNLLVSEGADLSLTDKLESDCLMWACVGGNMSIVKHLLSLKTFDINRKGIFMQTPVMMAAQRGHYDVYNLLVSEGADLSLTDRTTVTV